MLREGVYRHRRFHYGVHRYRYLKLVAAMAIMAAFIAVVVQVINHGGSRQLIHLLLKQEFPLEVILLEGAPGWSAPERQILDQTRKQGLAIGMYMLTGVNISDPRTYFLSYFASPPNGPERVGWTYSPKDPEFEGPILEPIPQDLPEQETPRLFDSKEVLVGIYHTHNSESYSGDGGEERADDGRGEILQIGKIIADGLNARGIRTVWSQEDHEQDDFNTAYSRSHDTGVRLLQEYPSMQLLFDVHRDGLIPGMSKSTVKVNGKNSARIMIVIGQMNPNWQKNEQFALELIAIAEEKYPGLIKTKLHYAAEARYNQHLSQGALLLEFGSQLNTLEEASVAAEAFVDVLSEWVYKRLESQNYTEVNAS